MRTNKPFSPTLLHSIQVTLKKKCRPAISRPPLVRSAADSTWKPRIAEVTKMRGATWKGHYDAETGRKSVDACFYNILIIRVLCDIVE